MDLNYFHRKFLEFVEYIKEKRWLFVLAVVFVCSGALYIYVEQYFEKQSSSEFLELINGQSKKFLEHEQFGVYEDIRQNFLKKDKKDISCLAKLASSLEPNMVLRSFGFKSDVFANSFRRYIKFAKQMNGEFGDEFDSVLEAKDSPWRELFISSKLFYNKFDGEKVDFSRILNLLFQIRKGSK